ncbi:MAG: endonuclease/exonuclease/phosphatase family protein [Crocinitomicaceae bacterium]|nr:endonuclease/exonuclease/phosphatase family protein [Crocinitomicaceae bacterium]
MSKIVRFSNLIRILTISCLVCLLLSYLAPFVHPNTLKIIPFFGLAYPIFLLLTVISLIYWAVLKSRMALLILCVLLIGGKLHFRIFAFGSDRKVIPEKEKLLHVMSYNVRLFDLYTADENNIYEKRNLIFEYIKNEDPDIICFQEFYHQDKPTKFKTRDTLVDILGIKDYHERFAHKLKGRQNFGVSILSKFPLIAKGDVMFSTQGDQDFNYCIFVDLVKNQDTFRIYNVHLQSIRLQQEDYSLFKDGGAAIEKKSMIRLLVDKLRIAYPKRAEQARAVIEHVQTSPYPTIVCGDFNDTPMSYAYNQFDKLLIDAFRESSFGIGSTYIGKVPAGRIDYIFHTPNLISSGFKIQRQKLSDHRAISCKIFKDTLQ